jgi:hypothetical protein
MNTSCVPNIDSLMDSLSRAANTTQIILHSIFDMIDLLGCDNVVPIYQAIFYESTCLYSVRAVMWVFGASLIMSTFGLLAITFRSAYSPTHYTYVYDDSTASIANHKTSII